MATHHIENGGGGNQYYFDANSNVPSQGQRPTQDRAYPSPVANITSVSSSEYTAYPAGVSGIRSQVQPERNTYNQDDPYQLPQQHQSVAGFNKTVSQQQYQSSPPSVPQVRATVRTVNSQEQQYASSGQYQQQQQYQRPQQAYPSYEQQVPPPQSQISPQQQHQYDPHQQQPGQQTGGSGHYQSPGSAQYPHQELDQRTESPSRGRDQHGQVFVYGFFHTNRICNVKYIHVQR